MQTTTGGFAKIAHIILWCAFLSVIAYGIGMLYVSRAPVTSRTAQPFRETAWEKLRTWTWQSYINQEYRFQFKLPAHWVVEEQQEEDSSWPEWRVTRANGLFRVTLHRGAPLCDATNAFTYMYVDAARVPLCERDADNGLQYILELPRDDLFFSLSCDYVFSLRTCSRLFATFRTLAQK
jgi:hypothetical protein